MNYEYCDGYTYTIKKGDTLYEISRSHKVPLSLLLRSNPFVDVFNLQVGDTLCIPTKQTPPKPCEMWGDCEEKPEPEQPEMPEEVMPPQNSEEDIKWKRYVIKPGDTMEEILNGNMTYLEAFGERNGWDNIYLLPGVAYFVPEEK